MKTLTLLAILWLPVQLCGQLRVEITDAFITLGDLEGAIDGWAGGDARTRVAPAPLPGTRRLVTRGQLSAWRRQHFDNSLDQQPLPDSVVFERAMRRLSAPEVQTIIYQSFNQRYPISKSDIVLDFEDLHEPLVPAGRVDFKALGSLALNRNSPVRLQWKDASGRTGGTNLKVRLEVPASYLQATRDIQPGESLTSANTKETHGPLPTFRDDYLVDSRQAEGLVAQTRIRSGSAVEQRFLIAETLVRRGDLIQLELSNNTVHLRVPARAEQDGRQGQAIRVRNLQSSRAVEAVVQSKAVVEVELP